MQTYQDGLPRRIGIIPWIPRPSRQQRRFLCGCSAGALVFFATRIAVTRLIVRPPIATLFGIAIPLASHGAEAAGAGVAVWAERRTG